MTVRDAWTNPAVPPMLHLQAGHSLRSRASVSAWASSSVRDRERSYLWLCSRGWRPAAWHRWPRAQGESHPGANTQLPGEDMQGFEGALFLSDVIDLGGKLLFLLRYYLPFFLPPPEIVLPS